MRERFRDLGEGMTRWWCTDDRDLVSPRVQVELNLSALPGLLRVYVCACVAVAVAGLVFVFPWALENWNMVMLVTHSCTSRRLFSLLPHAGQAARCHPLSLCPEKAILFPNGSHIMLLFVQTGYHTRGKGFWEDKIDVFVKEKRKICNHILFLQNYIVKHRNLQCLFLCFMFVLNNSTSSPHSLSFLKRNQVNAKGHFHNSSELPKEENSPSARFLQLHSGRHREERCCSFRGFTLIPL